MIDLFARYFDLRSEPSFSYDMSREHIRPMPGFVGSARGSKSEKQDRLIGFVCPTGGMFLWIAVYLESHPEYHKLGESAIRVLTERLFVRLAQKKVLVVPGFWFEGDDQTKATSGYLRISFSSASREEMQRGIKTLAHEVVAFMSGHGD